MLLQKTIDKVLLMLEIESIKSIPVKLLANLNSIDEICQLAGGRLISRQIIAQEIFNYVNEANKEHMKEHIKKKLN